MLSGCGNSMSYIKFFTFCVACAVLAIAFGCASRSHAPDPDELQARVEATHAEYRELIASQIEDPERAEAFAALSDERDSLIARHSMVVRQYSTAFKELNADYSSTREDFESLLQDYNRERRASQAEFVELMDKMKATTTKKEWEKLAKFELRKLNPRTMAYSTKGN